MSSFPLKVLAGFGALSAAASFGYGMHRVYYSPSNIKKKLIYEKLELASSDEDWKKNAKSYKEANDLRIEGLTIGNGDTDFSKLKEECEKLFKTSLKDTGVEDKLNKARKWCTKSKE